MPIDRPRLVRPVGDTNLVKGHEMFFVVEIPNCSSDYQLRFYKLPDIDTLVMQVNLSESCRNPKGTLYEKEGVAYKKITLDLEIGEYLIEIVDADTNVVTTGGAIKIVDSYVPPRPPSVKKSTAKANTKKATKR